MNVLDLFAGAVGGWSCGLTRAGYRTVAACEIVPWRRSVFAIGHPGCVMYGDVRELDAERLHADLGFLPDVIVGSPPCQEISTANCKGTGITDDHLFWEWVRLVFEIRPLWCAAENSPNARTSGIDGILDALEQGGYAAWPLVVGAEDVGANHPRKRMWLVAADAARLRHIGRREPERRPQGRNVEHGAVGAGDDPDADGRLAGGTRRHADGCLGLGAGADGEHPADADEPSRRRPPVSDGPASHHRPDPADARNAPVLERLRQRRVRTGSGAEPAQADLYDAADPDRPGYPLGPRLHDHDGEELPAALRAIGRAWPHWNGGLPGLAAACAAAGFGAVDDGAGAGLPPSLRNRAIAALGDAVIPQIPEAIGRAMRDLMTEYFHTIKKAR